MSIRVTCPGCHSRFNVSEKFAGKTGPCPKCKKSIKIPDAADEVKVHEPEHFGPKGKTGRAVLKPVFRKEASVSPVQITIIIASVVAYFVIALLIRFMVTDKMNFSDIAEFAFGAILALPLVFAGYTFLRDSELAPLRGKELWSRLGICAVMYAVLWLAMLLAAYMFNGYGIPTWVTAFLGMIVVGAMTAMMVLEFDFITGVIHYGLYLVACVLGRWVAGLGALPGMLKQEVTENPSVDVPGNDLPAVGSIAIDSCLAFIYQFNELVSCVSASCTYCG